MDRQTTRQMTSQSSKVRLQTWHLEKDLSLIPSHWRPAVPFQSPVEQKTFCHNLWACTLIFTFKIPNKGSEPITTPRESHRLAGRFLAGNIERFFFEEIVPNDSGEKSARVTSREKLFSGRNKEISLHIPCKSKKQQRKWKKNPSLLIGIFIPVQVQTMFGLYIARNIATNKWPYLGYPGTFLVISGFFSQEHFTALSDERWLMPTDRMAVWLWFTDKQVVALNA